MTALIAPLAGIAAVALAAVLLQLAKARQRRRLVGAIASPTMAGPAILFFSGDACSICHTAQRPALDRLTPELGDRIPVREIDVAEESGLARRFGVLTLPTTIVLDREGRTVAVNAGFAPTSLLHEQLVQGGVVAG
jgi:thioredoxin 1